MESESMSQADACQKIGMTVSTFWRRFFTWTRCKLICFRHKKNGAIHSAGRPRQCTAETDDALKAEIPRAMLAGRGLRKRTSFTRFIQNQRDLQRKARGLKRIRNPPSKTTIWRAIKRNSFVLKRAEPQTEARARACGSLCAWQLMACLVGAQEIDRLGNRIRPGNKFNLDSTSFVLTDRCIIVDPTVCDKGVLQSMRKKKHALKSIEGSGLGKYLRVRALFLVFGDGATVAPCFWLRCLPAGTKFSATRHVLKARECTVSLTLLAALKCSLIWISLFCCAAGDNNVQ